MASDAQMVSDVLVESGVLSVEDLERVLMAMANGDAVGPGSALTAGNGASAATSEGTPPAPPEAAPPPPADAVGGGAPLSLLDPPTLEGMPADPIRDTGPLAALGLPDPASGAPVAPSVAPFAAGPAQEIEATSVPPMVLPEPTPTPPMDALEETHQMPVMAIELPPQEAAAEIVSPDATPVASPPGSAPAGPPVIAPIEPEAVRSKSSATAPSELITLLESAAAQKASDLHLHAGQPPRMRLNGEFVKVPGGLVDSTTTEALLKTLLDEEQLRQLEVEGQVDFAYTLPGIARLRSNAYRHRFGTDVVFRLVALQPPTLAELSLPETLSRFGEYHQGMVLITGPSGCGKSSTMAALVNGINQSRPDHVLTVEDPIEYVHQSRQCNVNQRQAGKHTASFARALKAALREDPDVIAIGELRDLETIRLALTAAETGHLVLATMHTKDSIGTINRVIGSFPPEEQAQVRAMLSESLRAIVSQRLARKKDGSGRIPALEILLATTAVGNLIREQKTFQIPSVLQSGASQGMCSMDASLGKLLKAGIIEREEALRLCENPAALGA